jgi:hypothetical protein
MQALVGLSSQPVQVESITHESITLRISDPRILEGTRLVTELLNGTGDFRRLVRLEVTEIIRLAEGGYRIESKLQAPLTNEVSDPRCARTVEHPM